MTDDSPKRRGARLKTDPDLLPQTSPQLRVLISELNKLINDSDATLEQLATSLSGVTDRRALSRILRADQVPDVYVVEQVVRLCADRLGEPHPPVLERFRALRREAETASRGAGEPPSPVSADGLEALLELVWSGEAELAAEHLCVQHGDDHPAAARLLQQLGTRDPGGVAMVMRALARKVGHKHTERLLQALREINPDVADQVEQVPAPAPEPAVEVQSAEPPRQSIVDLDPMVGVSRRWAAQVRAGEAEQVAREMIVECTLPPSETHESSFFSLRENLAKRFAGDPNIDVELFTKHMVAMSKDRPDNGSVLPVLWSALVRQGQAKTLASFTLRVDFQGKESRKGFADILAATPRPDVLAVFAEYTLDTLGKTALRQLQKLMPALPRALCQAILEAWSRRGDDLAGALFPTLCGNAAELAAWIEHDLELTVRLMNLGLSPADADTADTRQDSSRPASAVPEAERTLAEAVVELARAAPERVLPLVSTLLINFPSAAAELLFAMEDLRLAEGVRTGVMVLDRLIVQDPEAVPNQLAALILTPAGLPGPMLSELIQQHAAQARSIVLCLLHGYRTQLARDIAGIVGDVRAQAFSTALLSELAQRHPRGPWGYAVDLLGRGDCRGAGELLRSKSMDDLQATQ